MITHFVSTASSNTECGSPLHGNTAVFEGEVISGEKIRYLFGTEFFFHLVPIEYGWEIAVAHKTFPGNLARLTPPWHFVPNPRFIEGWHFRNRSNTGPNDGSVNASQNLREFIFSPEVAYGQVLQRKPTPKEIERISQFGRGTLEVMNYELDEKRPGQRATMIRMNFRACLSWASDY